MANRPKLKHQKHNPVISKRTVGGLLIVCLSLFMIYLLVQDEIVTESEQDKVLSEAQPTQDETYTESGQDEAFAEGAQYEILREAQPTQSGDKIEVVEMFWYKCPHCYALEPYLEEWKENKAGNTEFVPIPAVLGKSWEFDARVYYTLQALGLDKQLHSKLYNALHKKRKVIKTKEQFADWAVENGANREKLLAMFDSFTVQSKINFSKVMSRKYDIPGVPAIIVDGKYRTSATLAGSNNKLIEVIDYLIELAAKNKSG